MNSITTSDCPFSFELKESHPYISMAQHDELTDGEVRKGSSKPIRALISHFYCLFFGITKCIALLG